MAMEVEADRARCSLCGKNYTRLRGNFPTSYQRIHKGVGYIPICSDCVEGLYNEYLAQCKDAEMAVRQVCRKLDLYWGKEVYDYVAPKSTSKSLMLRYIAKLNSGSYIGKSYDDTLSDEGTLWTFGERGRPLNISEETSDEPKKTEAEALAEIDEDVINFWGSGYTADMYKELEQRRSYWMSRLPEGIELDIGTEVIIKQICSLELDINRDRAAGNPVDKSINTLNSLLGSGNLKPVQKKQEDTEASIVNTPMGVWLQRYETKRPLPDKYEDSKLLKYVFTWMGHVLKMLGVKNGYSQMYQDTVDRLRVEKPEYEGDDEELMTDYMNGEFEIDGSLIDEGDEQDE